MAEMMSALCHECTRSQYRRMTSSWSFAPQRVTRAPQGSLRGALRLLAADLTLGQSLQRVGGSWAVMLKASETKNRRALEYALPAMLGPALQRYLERFRPVLFGSAAHQGLWASAKGVPLTGDAIYHAVCRRTKTAFGEPVNLHLFRDGAATFWALKDPTRVAAVSGLLGHEPRITERHYNQANGIRAGRKLADALAQQMSNAL
jgi:integrase